MAPEVCANCGADIPRNAKACPECGADEETGWSHATAEGLDLPDEEFNYEEFVKHEFGGEKKSPVPHGIRWFWWVVAVLLLASFLWAFLR
jgi:hypothetical protein